MALYCQRAPFGPLEIYTQDVEQTDKRRQSKTSCDAEYTRFRRPLH